MMNTEERVMYNRLLMSCQALNGLFQAWIVRAGKRMSNVRFPAISSRKRLDKVEISFIIWFADMLVKVGAARTGRKCFFRAFILGSVLRKWGVPVAMNIGLCNLKSSKAKGHCWLTLNGAPFAEKDDPKEKFPFQIGSGSNGVHYWSGLIE